MTKLSTSLPAVWTSSPLDKTFPWYHMWTHTQTDTHIYSHDPIFISASLSVRLPWLWMALISTVTNPHRDPTLKNIMITSDCIFQRQSALFLFPVLWFKGQNNTRKWEKNEENKMEILLDGSWLTCYCKISFSTEGLSVMSSVSVPRCQNKLWNEHQIWNWKYRDVALPSH